MKTNPWTVILLLCLSRAAYAGWSSNGGDFTKDQYNIWFFGDAPIEYCIERGPGYPLNRAELRELVAEALSDWARFFQKYEMDRRVIGAPRDPFPGQFPDHMPRGMSLTFVERPTCVDPKHQLRLLFGRTDRIVEGHLTWRRRFTIAASFAGDYDHETYRNGGIVWLKNASWLRERVSIKHLLLHELGHVFGMTHDSVFVMDDKVAYHVYGEDNQCAESHGGIGDYLGQIEAPGWPYRPLRGAPVELTYDGGGADHDKTAGETCIPQGYYPNRLLPEELRRHAGIALNGFHALALELIGENYAGIALRLTLKPFGGKPLELRGTFEHDADTFYSAFLHAPSLCTYWEPKQGKPWPKPEAFTLDLWCEGLDLERAQFPASGSFRLGNEVFPALIEQRDGPSPKLFMPASGRWWTFAHWHRLDPVPPDEEENSSLVR